MPQSQGLPKKAMVLAAGFGRRLRPITDNLPKPLVRLRGRTMIDHALDRLVEAGVEQVVVNLHYLGDQIVEQLGKRDDLAIEYSREDPILETGGGVKLALSRLGPEPFFVVNADICWTDGCGSALQRLAAAWRDETMDALLLLQPMVSAIGYDGWAGDFMLDPLGRVRRRGEREVSPFLFAGIQILHPRLFAGSPADSAGAVQGGAFSLNLLYDRAAETERLWGQRHDGLWFHAGTPEGLDAVEDALHHLAASAGTR